MKRIRITYETVTPESAERGDVASQGWIDEQGVDFQSAEQLAEYLRDAGATEWEGNWWSEPDGHTDPQTGEHTRQSYHPVDGEWTVEELRIVNAILKNQYTAMFEHTSGGDGLLPPAHKGYYELFSVIVCAPDRDSAESLAMDAMYEDRSANHPNFVNRAVDDLAVRLTR